MAERPYDRPSIFSRVDQAGMIDRLEHSPLDDDEVGYLSDLDDAGHRQVAPSLMDGIRIFSGEPVQHSDEAAAVSAVPSADAPGPDEAPAAQDFILFGPAGRTPGAADLPTSLPNGGAS